MTFHVVPTDERTGPSAGAPDQQTEPYIIKHSQPQRLIAAAALIHGGSNQIECAHAKMSLRFVPVYTGEPVRKTEQERQMPRAPRYRFRGDPGCKGDVVALFPSRNAQRA